MKSFHRSRRWRTGVERLKLKELFVHRRKEEVYKWLSIKEVLGFNIQCPMSRLSMSAEIRSGGGQSGLLRCLWVGMEGQRTASK